MSIFVINYAHSFPDEAIVSSWQRQFRHWRRFRLCMSKKVHTIRRQLIQRHLDRLREIDARLRFVHPSEGIILLPWYLPDPIWAPLRKEDDRRAIILNLNGLLCHVVESQYDEKDPLYSSKLIKYPINQYRYVLCHKDAHEFLDWCIQFFDVFIWSACRRTKLFEIINRVFSQQLSKIAGVLSQEHCSKATWIVQSRQVFFKKLETFWGLHPLYNKKNTLIIDDSFYKVFFGNPQGNSLIVPQLYHQTSEQRITFLKEDLRNWLFLWLQNDDRQKYVRDNAFEETPNQFSDDVMKKYNEELDLEIKMRNEEEIRLRHAQDHAAAMREEWFEREKRRCEEAHAEIMRQLDSE